MNWECQTDSDLAGFPARRECHGDAEPWNGATAGPYAFGQPTAIGPSHDAEQTGEDRFDVTADVIANTSSWLLRLADDTKVSKVLYHSREWVERHPEASAQLAPRLVLNMTRNY